MREPRTVRDGPHGAFHAVQMTAGVCNAHVKYDLRKNPLDVRRAIASRWISLNRRASSSGVIPSKPGSAQGDNSTSPGRSRIEDGRAIVVLQRCLEIVRPHVGLPEHPNQAMAAGSLEWEIESEGGKEEDDQTDTQTSSRLRDSMAEEISKPDPRPGPRQSAHGAVAKKAGDARLCRTGQCACDRVQLRQEPGAAQKCPGVGAGDVLSAADERPGTDGEPVEHLQRSQTVPSAQAIPRQVRSE